MSSQLLRGLGDAAAIRSEAPLGSPCLVAWKTSRYGVLKETRKDTGGRYDQSIRRIHHDACVLPSC
jgi:hypothetical protein